MTFLWLGIGLAVGVATRQLHDKGKMWQGNLLFGTFILVLLSWFVYALWGVLME